MCLALPVYMGDVQMEMRDVAESLNVTCLMMQGGRGSVSYVCALRLFFTFVYHCPFHQVIFRVVSLLCLTN